MQTFDLMISSLFPLPRINEIEKRLALGEAGNKLAQSPFLLSEPDIGVFLQETVYIGIDTQYYFPVDSTIILLDMAFDIIEEPVSGFSSADGSLLYKILVKLFDVNLRSWQAYNGKSVALTRYPSPSIRHRMKPLMAYGAHLVCDFG